MNSLIRIDRSGNLGGDRPRDRYHQSAKTEAATGRYSLSELGCGGFEQGTDIFEILSVNEHDIVLRVGNEEHVVTKEEPVLIEYTYNVHADDGPAWTAYDDLEFRMI